MQINGKQATTYHPKVLEEYALMRDTAKTKVHNFGASYLRKCTRQDLGKLLKIEHRWLFVATFLGSCGIIVNILHRRQL